MFNGMASVRIKRAIRIVGQMPGRAARCRSDGRGCATVYPLGGIPGNLGSAGFI
jgi:hypothetical protein